MTNVGKLRNGWSDWHQMLHTSADSSGNEHELESKQIRPSRPIGGILGVSWGQQFKSVKGGQTIAMVAIINHSPLLAQLPVSDGIWVSGV